LLLAVGYCQLAVSLNDGAVVAVDGCSQGYDDASDTSIEGYDESEYEAMYEAARDALNRNELPQEVYDRINEATAKAEAEGRKWRSLNEIEIAMRHMFGMH
jgi:hypothetical protein